MYVYIQLYIQWHSFNFMKKASDEKITVRDDIYMYIYIILILLF